MEKVTKIRQIIYLNTQIKLEKALLIMKTIDYYKKIGYSFGVPKEKWVIDTG